MSNTIKPAAGLEIAFFCVVVMLGIRTPFVVLWASKIAEALGELVPIPRPVLVRRINSFVPNPKYWLKVKAFEVELPAPILQFQFKLSVK